MLSLESRKTLTLHFHQVYLQPKLFYRILMMHEDVDNPYVWMWFFFVFVCFGTKRCR